MKRLFAICAALLILAGCSYRADTNTTTAANQLKPVSFNTAGAPTVSFSVPDMMCPEGCGVKVKEILSGQPGAKEVVVDFDAKTATVAIEEGKFNPNAAVAALVDHQFGNSAVKGDVPTGAAAAPAPKHE